ncbi:MAG: carotenoid biosynthesis protein [Ignavibacteriaceae bacterium]
MNYTKQAQHKYSLYFIVIIYIVGIIGHLIPDTREFFITLTPYSILITGGLTLFLSVRNADKKFILWLVITLFLTFAIEVAGAITGRIFGQYYYGNVLGFSLLEVPVIISLNWVLIILGAASLFAGLKLNILYTSLLAAGAGTIYDYFLESIAIRFNYWYWDLNIVPIQNYVAWFIIIFISTAALLKVCPKYQKGISGEYLLIQLLFFIILSLFIS